MEEMERDHIMNALQSSGGKVSGIGGAAELLKIQPQTLYSKMKNWELIKDINNLYSHYHSVHSIGADFSPLFNKHKI